VIDETVVGRPITPSHGGHVGLLCTAGSLNGTFGTGEERHIARWRSVKYVTEFHEQEEDARIMHCRRNRTHRGSLNIPGTKNFGWGAVAQVYATYTGEKDCNGRLERILSAAGFRVGVLRASVPTHKREELYERQLESGFEVVICHPKLVETGLDYVECELVVCDLQRYVSFLKRVPEGSG
jgi:hypothetical protein